MTDATLRIKVDSSEVSKGAKSLDDLATASGEAEKGAQKVEKSTISMSGAAKAATSALAALGVTLSARQIIKYADEWQGAENRLKLVTGSATELASAQQALLQIANQTRTSVTATSDLYTTLARSTADAGLSAKELQGITKTINQSFAISGASAAAMDGALRQLSQAFASGALRGDEFNSVNEQAPRLMDAVALSLNMTRGELRDFAAQGGITAEIVIKALKDSAQAIDQEFSQATATFGGNMTIANNNLMQFIGSAQLTKAAVGAAGGAIVLMSENLDLLVDIVVGATLVIGTRMAIGLAGMASAAGVATAATTALSTAMAFLGGPVGIAITVVAGLAVLGKRLYDNKKEADALEISTRELAAAEAYHSSVIKNNVMSLDQLQAELSVARGELHNVTSAMGEGSAESLNMSREVGRLEMLITEMGGSIEQTTGAVQSQSAAVVQLTKDEQDLIDTIESKITQLNAERMALNMTERELFIHNATIVKGTQLTAEQAAGIRDAAAALYDERQQIESATKAQEALTKERQKAAEHTAKLVTENKRAELQLVLNERQQAIYNAVMSAGTKLTTEQMIAIEASISSLYDQRDAIAATTAEAKRNQEAVDVWTKLSTRGAEQRASAEIESQRKQEEAMTRTHEYLTTSFIDIFNNGKNAFDNIAKAFSAMIQRMLAEWAASKLMDFIGIGTGTAAANPFSQIASSAIGTAVKSALGIGGSTAAAGTAAGGTAAGTGIGASIGSAGTAIMGGVKAVGSAVSGGLSSAGALIAANPLLAGVAVAALAAAALAEKPTYSSNAGLLIHDAPGASADRKFAVSPFASGFSPVGFARREDQGAATAVIDVFRKYDASLTEIANAAGLKVNFTNNPFGGFDERGQGNGLFLGTAAEQGKGITSASMSEQLTQFTKQWVEALGGQISAQDKSYLLASGSADVLLERAAELGKAEMGRLDGSHAGGLTMVPFNGYRAELHRGEEVLRANDPRNQNNGSGMVAEMRSMLAEMRQMAYYTKRTSDLLLRVTRDGDSLVTVAA
jgi:tape measure domain-containing protein